MKYIHQFKLSESAPSYRIYRADGITARLDFFEHILRVAFVRDGEYLFPTYTVCPDGNCPREGRDKLSCDGFVPIVPSVTEDENSVSFSIDNVKIGIELLNFRMEYSTSSGLLYQDREHISYNFEHELGRGSMHFVSREADEKIYGLGDKTGNVNKNGCSFKLAASDSVGFDARSTDPLYKQLPFYICESSGGAYGIYYDTYSNGEISFGKEIDGYYPPYKAFRCNEENLVYYVIFGTVPEILRRFSAMCGPMAFPPKWSLEYCGSTMAYTDAPDADAQLRGFIEKCDSYGIKPGGFYLSSGYTQIGDKRCVFHWNTDKIPSPEGLAEFFEAHGVQFIANIKPAFLTIHPMYDMIAQNGWFLHYEDGTTAVFPFWGGMGSYLDFTNPEAYDFWTECVRRKLVDKGYKNTWNDNNEYDVCSEEVYACGFGHPVKACDIRPLFSFLMTMASLAAQDHSLRPMAVTRCGIGGLQRISSTWTGDNQSSFEDFRYNHKMAMTMSLSGFYNFGQDIGGFAGPRPGKELLMRWIQYGLFTPRFVLHSWNADGSSTMPWLYPELIPAVKRLFDLRRALIPYLYSEMYRSVQTHDPVIYPIFLKYPDYDRESDCFFFGDSILACPVFDEGAENVTVTLPGLDTWYLAGDILSADFENNSEPATSVRGSALYVPGTYTLPCAHDGLPVWFIKAGSVIPYSIAGQLSFMVYPIKEGSYVSEYFEDDGVSPVTPESHRIVRFEVKCTDKEVIIKTGCSAPKTTASPTHQDADKSVSGIFGSGHENAPDIRLAGGDGRRLVIMD